MSRPTTNVTLTLRKRSSGYRVTTFQAEDFNHAHALAGILIASDVYGRCFVRATDWQGNELFVLGLDKAAADRLQEPAPQALPTYQPATLRAAVRNPYGAAVQDAEVFEVEEPASQFARYGVPPVPTGSRFRLPPAGGNGNGNG